MSIRFQADNDLKFGIVKAVRRREPTIDFVSAQEAGLDGLPDPELLDRAAREGRVVVSHDRRTMIDHFRDHLVAGKPSPGLLIVSQGAAIIEVVEALVYVWSLSDQGDLRDQAYYLPSIQSVRDKMRSRCLQPRARICNTQLALRRRQGRQRCEIHAHFVARLRHPDRPYARVTPLFHIGHRIAHFLARAQRARPPLSDRSPRQGPFQEQARPLRLPRHRPGPSRQDSFAGPLRTCDAVSEGLPMVFEVESRKSIAEIDAAIRDAATRHKFGVLSVIDLKKKMQEKGLDFTSECSVYEVCNPHQAKRALEANGAVSTALPCRISVYGNPGAYKIATILPTAMMSVFGTPGVDEVAIEVETDIVAMMKESA